MTDNNKAPKVQVQMHLSLSQVRTLDDPGEITAALLGMARKGHEHYCTTLIPAKIAVNASMSGRFELLHFFRRIVKREIEPDALPGTADERATGDALKELAGDSGQPALPAGTDEQQAAGDALAGLAQEADER